MRILHIVLALSAMSFAAPAVLATGGCGGYNDGSLYALSCSSEYHDSQCSTSCYQSDAHSDSAGAGYNSPGGSFGVWAGRSDYAYCNYSSPYYCYQDQSAAAGAGVSTFVPFVGPVNQWGGATSDSGQTQSSSGSSCAWTLYTSAGVVPLWTDCTLTAPWLP